MRTSRRELLRTLAAGAAALVPIACESGARPNVPADP